jgi:hypothetical protein
MKFKLYINKGLIKPSARRNPDLYLVKARRTVVSTQKGNKQTNYTTHNGRPAIVSHEELPGFFQDISAKDGMLLWYKYLDEPSTDDGELDPGETPEEEVQDPEALKPADEDPLSSLSGEEPPDSDMSAEDFAQQRQELDQQASDARDALGGIGAEPSSSPEVPVGPKPPSDSGPYRQSQKPADASSGPGGLFDSVGEGFEEGSLGSSETQKRVVDELDSALSDYIVGAFSGEGTGVKDFPKRMRDLALKMGRAPGDSRPDRWENQVKFWGRIRDKLDQFEGRPGVGVELDHVRKIVDKELKGLDRRSPENMSAMDVRRKNYEKTRAAKKTQSTPATSKESEDKLKVSELRAAREKPKKEAPKPEKKLSRKEQEEADAAAWLRDNPEFAQDPDEAQAPKGKKEQEEWEKEGWESKEDYESYAQEEPSDIEEASFGEDFSRVQERTDDEVDETAGSDGLSQRESLELDAQEDEKKAAAAAAQRRMKARVKGPQFYEPELAGYGSATDRAVEKVRGDVASEQQLQGQSLERLKDDPKQGIYGRAWATPNPDKYKKNYGKDVHDFASYTIDDHLEAIRNADSAMEADPESEDYFDHANESAFHRELLEDKLSSIGSVKNSILSEHKTEEDFHALGDKLEAHNVDSRVARLRAKADPTPLDSSEKIRERIAKLEAEGGHTASLKQKLARVEEDEAYIDDLSEETPAEARKRENFRNEFRREKIAQYEDNPHPTAQGLARRLKAEMEGDAAGEFAKKPEASKAPVDEPTDAELGPKDAPKEEAKKPTYRFSPGAARVLGITEKTAASMGLTHVSSSARQHALEMTDEQAADLRMKLQEKIDSGELSAKDKRSANAAVSSLKKQLDKRGFDHDKHGLAYEEKQRQKAEAGPAEEAPAAEEEAAEEPETAEEPEAAEESEQSKSRLEQLKEWDEMPHDEFFEFEAGTEGWDEDEAEAEKRVAEATDRESRLAAAKDREDLAAMRKRAESYAKDRWDGMSAEEQAAISDDVLPDYLKRRRKEPSGKKASPAKKKAPAKKPKLTKTQAAAKAAQKRTTKEARATGKKPKPAKTEAEKKARAKEAQKDLNVTAESMGKQPKAEPKKAAAKESAKDFADRVHAAINAGDAKKFGPRKHYISSVYAQDPSLADNLDHFKDKLREAMSAGHITMSRADLVEAMDKDLLKESKTEHVGSQFNFITHDKDPNADPVQRESAREKAKKEKAEASQENVNRESLKSSEKKMTDHLSSHAQKLSAKAPTGLASLADLKDALGVPWEDAKGVINKLHDEGKIELHREDNRPMITDRVKDAAVKVGPETRHLYRWIGDSTRSSKKKAPEKKAPEKKAPKEKKAPEKKAPKEKKTPEKKAPEKKAPEKKAPEKKAPEKKAPEKKAPEKKAPEKKAPEKFADPATDWDTFEQALEEAETKASKPKPLAKPSYDAKQSAKRAQNNLKNLAQKRAEKAADKKPPQAPEKFGDTKKIDSRKVPKKPPQAPEKFGDTKKIDSRKVPKKPPQTSEAGEQLQLDLAAPEESRREQARMAQQRLISEAQAPQKAPQAEERPAPDEEVYDLDSDDSDVRYSKDSQSDIAEDYHQVPMDHYRQAKIAEANGNKDDANWHRTQARGKTAHYDGVYHADLRDKLRDAGYDTDAKYHDNARVDRVMEAVQNAKATAATEPDAKRNTEEDVLQARNPVKVNEATGIPDTVDGLDPDEVHAQLQEHKLNKPEKDTSEYDKTSEDHEEAKQALRDHQVKRVSDTKKDSHDKKTQELKEKVNDTLRDRNAAKRAMEKEHKQATQEHKATEKELTSQHMTAKRQAAQAKTNTTPAQDAKADEGNQEDNEESERERTNRIFLDMQRTWNSGIRLGEQAGTAAATAEGGARIPLLVTGGSFATHHHLLRKPGKKDKPGGSKANTTKAPKILGASKRAQGK